MKSILDESVFYRLVPMTGTHFHTFDVGTCRRSSSERYPKAKKVGSYLCHSSMANDKNHRRHRAHGATSSKPLQVVVEICCRTDSRRALQRLVGLSSVIPSGGGGEGAMTYFGQADFGYGQADFGHKPSRF